MTRRVVAVLFDGFLLLDLAGPFGALEIAGHYGNPRYTLEVTSVDGRIIRSSSGVPIETKPFIPDGGVDTLLIPGGFGTETGVDDQRLLSLIRDVSVQARRSASVCSGSFLLAAAGLLDGKRATTHWGGVAKLRRDFPRVRVDGDCIFTVDGNVWTSAGITAGIDLALALIEADHGFGIAQKVAQGLVVYHRRPGGQRQFSAALELQGPSGRFGALLDWVREHVDERLSVDRLAAEYGLSPRHFSRAFADATGISPGKAIERLRVDHARSDVVAGEENLEIVARRYGFRTAAQMRRSFTRVLGQPPQALRRSR